MADVLTVEQFREAHQAFLDVASYPDAAVESYLTLATSRVKAERWGDMQAQGIGLFVAHMLAMDNADNIAATRGASGSQASGPIASKSIGGASISYDTSSAMLKDGGDWNTTSYGRRFLRMARMAGMGGLQIV